MPADETDVIENPLEDDDLEEEETYRTYRMDFENKRIVGEVDGIEAALQATAKALNTRRYAHIIYDAQYGCDLFNKIGNASLTDDFLDSDISVMLDDLVQNDESIIEIEDLEYELQGRDGVKLSMTLVTIFGDASLEGEVDNDG